MGSNDNYALWRDRRRGTGRPALISRFEIDSQDCFPPTRYRDRAIFHTSLISQPVPCHCTQSPTTMRSLISPATPKNATQRDVETAGAAVPDPTAHTDLNTGAVVGRKTKEERLFVARLDIFLLVYGCCSQVGEAFAIAFERIPRVVALTDAPLSFR